MAQPVNTITLGGTDISSRVKSPRGRPVVVFGRGAAFDGGAAPPGYARIVVANNDNAFNPRNSGSSLASVLKLGKPVRITCTYSAVTYYLFHGFLRRIVPLDDHFAELHCEDALFNFGRRETSLEGSFGRSVSGFRGAVLDDIGESGSNRNLSNAGPEQTVCYTGADVAPVLFLLEELNLATGSIHFIKPTSSAYQYTTIDRTVLQSNTSSETWSDSDLANPFAAALNALDYTDERIINQQRVTATPRMLEELPTTVWERQRLVLGASESWTRWATFDNPTFEQELSYDTGSGGGTATITAFRHSAKLVFTANASGWEVADIAISGREALAEDWDSQLAEDSTSQTAYGLLRGPAISSDYLPTSEWARGLASWIIYRYKDPRANPNPMFINRFPTQLTREVGDRITYTSSEHSMSAVECLIVAFRTTIMGGGEWQTEYQLEEVPAALTLFTVGGTSGQGVGGTGILAY